MQVFLKQYGERRTGTNYIRYLLRENYSNAVVLMHALGDKHSPPAPFDEIWRASRDAADPALEFISRATHAMPAESTIQGNAGQQQELERLAQPVAEAFAGGSLGFVVSVKDPYAWALSFAQYERWGRRGPSARRYDARLAGACKAFNDRYRAWLALAAERPAHVHIVRYEDLLADVEQTLRMLERKFRLHRSTPEVVDAANAMGAALWDHDNYHPTKYSFRKREFYLQRQYLGHLSLLDRELITRSIDWSLLATLGYEPAGGAIAISNASSIAAPRTSPDALGTRATPSGDASSAHDLTASP